MNKMLMHIPMMNLNNKLINLLKNINTKLKLTLMISIDKMSMNSGV